MKYTLYIFILFLTYSCKTKSTPETPSSKLWKSGIDTITLPVNDTITVPPYGSELIFDSSWITIGDNTKSLKSRIKKHHKKRDWASLLIGSKWQEKPSQLYEDSVGLGYDTSFHIEKQQSVLSSMTGDFKGTPLTDQIAKVLSRANVDTTPIHLGHITIFTDSVIVLHWDTLKTIVSYVDTSVEARPNLIEWKYLYYVRERNNYHYRDWHYLELDKKPIKKSIVILEARILDFKK